jgi:hypothetical protein
MASVIISSMMALKNMFEGGNLGMFMLFFGTMIFIISPILTYFYGKRLFLGLWL